MSSRRLRSVALASLAGLFIGGVVAYTSTRRPTIVDARPVGPALTGIFEGIDIERRQIPVRLIPVVEGVGQPTDLAFVPGHPDKLIVSSKWGTLHLVDLTAGTRTDWLWLPVLDALEGGVLGVAFDPEFKRSGRLFVHHNPRSGDAVLSVLSEIQVDPQTLQDPEMVGDLLTIPQPYGTHNAGKIAFGPDGMLYMVLGDGKAGEPMRRSQDRSSLLGSLLRLDVSSVGTYTVPKDNPFVGVPGVRPEIWAYGLRNPWRFSFDRRGRPVVADVGEARWEEINIVAAGDNLGWPEREGWDCYEPPEGCPRAGRIDPVLTYDHTEGISITGGVEWAADGPLRQMYLFGDFGTGRLWAAQLPFPRRPIRQVTALGRFNISPTAFVRAPDGQVWVADFRSERVYRIESAL
ncbi:MAG: PQQ-dependent sugar dehydrogenase [Myxococcota bacterium]